MNGPSIEPTAVSLPSVALGKEDLRREQRRRDMIEYLRGQGCLFDDRQIWKDLGARGIPKIPDSVLQAACDDGGRVVLSGLSINQMAGALIEGEHRVNIGNNAKQGQVIYESGPLTWKSLPSHANRDTLGKPKAEVVTGSNPAPLARDLFAERAFSSMKGEQPRGSKNVLVFAEEAGVVVGSYADPRTKEIVLYIGKANCHDQGQDHICAAEYGPPRMSA